ncbi:MAG: hypothetical protein AAFR74_06795 [Pseudomonadota bacterium]
MKSLFSSFLMLIAALSFALQATATPCTAGQEEAAMTMAAEMPCHDMHANHTELPDQPEHTSDTCCCPVLVSPVFTFAAIDLPTVLPELRLWNLPLQQAALSGPSEFEPPPPRA